MGTTDFNLQGGRTRTFKGFVQFQSPDGGNTEYYRIKERQSVRIDFRFNYDTHYTDAGQKVLDPSGYNHTFAMDLKTTSDLFDDTWLDADAATAGLTSTPKVPLEDGNDMIWQTLSYWIARGNANEALQITFVATLKALTGPTRSTGDAPKYDAGDAAEKWVHMKFVLQPNAFGPITYGTGGSNEIGISGDILSIDYIKRTSSATPTA